MSAGTTEPNCEDCADTGTEWVGSEYIPSSGRDVSCRTCKKGEED